MQNDRDSERKSFEEQPNCVLTRVGVLGQVGRFRSIDQRLFQRGERVVCRTPRGVEVGEVLTSMEFNASSETSFDGRLLRRMTPEDELLWGHLRELGQNAQQTCELWLQRQGNPCVLLDVEPLMDGKTLYFHFLSHVESDLQDYLDKLVALYEEQVRNSQFAKLLDEGCGPGCGTPEAKNGCGSRGGCAVCQVANACKKNVP